MNELDKRKEFAEKMKAICKSAQEELKKHDVPRHELWCKTRKSIKDISVEMGLDSELEMLGEQRKTLGEAIKYFSGGDF